MSLINDALRKARKEAAERDADERGVTYRPPRAHLPTERSWLPALAGVVLGAVLAAAAFWLLIPRSSTDEASTPPPTETRSEAAVSPPEPPPAEPATTSEPAAVPPASAPRPSEPPPSEPPPSKPPGAGEVTEEETPEVPIVETIEPAEDATPGEPTEEPPEEPTEEPAEGPTAAPTPGTEDVQRVKAPEQVGQVDEATYVLEATVDGVALRLDFIVWGASPFAQINGRQVSVGQSVEGFLVRDITREEVTLEGAGGPFTLRIR